MTGYDLSWEQQKWVNELHPYIILHNNQTTQFCSNALHSYALTSKFFVVWRLELFSEMAKSGLLQPSSDDSNSSKTKKKQPNKQQQQQPIVAPKKEDSICVANKPVKITTPVSILIESLVKNLCMAYEKDHKKATVVYNLICDKLFQMKLIDESYTMKEFEGMRSQYQKAFYQLFNAAMGSDSAVPLAPVRPNCEIISSHYHDEFDEMEYIAGGGFGQVSNSFWSF